MFPDNEINRLANPKFLTVRATKQKNKGGVGNTHSGGSGQHVDKKIKLDLVDHSKNHGIPYNYSIAGEAEQTDLNPDQGSNQSKLISTVMDQSKKSISRAQSADPE